MIALVSTTIRGSPRAGVLDSALVWRWMSPTASAARTRSFRDRQPDHAQPQEDRDPERQPRPERRIELRERQPKEEAHQQTQEQTRHGGHELRGGEGFDLPDQPTGRDDAQVRQDREPDDGPGHDPARKERPGIFDVSEQAVAAGGGGKPNDTPERGPKETDVSDQEVPRRSAGAGRGRPAGRSA
jgi:hypothetical protein